MQRRHKGAAPAVASPELPAGRAAHIAVQTDMFSKSLLFDTDLVQLKAARQAAQPNDEPGTDML